MRRYEGTLLFSPSDLVGFLACRQISLYDRIHIDTPLAMAEDDEEAQLLQERGLEHERAYLAFLRKEGLTVSEIPTGNLELAARETLAAMQAGADVIYQAAFYSAPWHGFADFLRRVPRPSAFGAYGYEPYDTKLARNPTPKHVLQLAGYSKMLATAQNAVPHSMHIILGDNRQASFRVSEFQRFHRRVEGRFEEHVQNNGAVPPPDPCSHCDFCRWREHCEDAWGRSDHLSRIAGILKSQMQKLREAGIKTVVDLAKTKAETRIPRLAPATFEKLQALASIQVRSRQEGKALFEILETGPDRGLFRLPKPDAGDIFFDMEGDPHYPDGLEYLFGLVWSGKRGTEYKTFWAHGRAEERQAFENFMDFLDAHFKQHPNAHLYHYAHYEPTALKRLSSAHGTREAVLDNFLRQSVFCDLYKIVRECLRTSAPGLSLKDIEIFYRGRRQGEVATAGQSVVVYERWRKSNEPELLEFIKRYNEEDCLSTLELRDWLLSLRSKKMPWSNPGSNSADEEKASGSIDRELARAELIEAIIKNGTHLSEPVRQLVADLMDFHRREAKPGWWAYFERQDTPDEILIDDPEAIGEVTPKPGHQPIPINRSTLHAYRFPPQDTKLAKGDRPKLISMGTEVGEIHSIDTAKGDLVLKIGPGKVAPSGRFSLGPSSPFMNRVLVEALIRFGQTIADGTSTYPALESFLSRAIPRIRTINPGDPIAKETDDLIPAISKAVAELDFSYLFIQGPPGSGKTHSSAHVIVDLIQKGKKVGVSSNSHKAINNLLRKIEEVSLERGVRFDGIKKSTAGDDETLLGGRLIHDVFSNSKVDLDANLFGGTAWLFADPRLDQALDYLFVDEAGQVSLGNLIAMGTAARNLVLIGDQMQLGQPIQGVHPGESGQSALDFLLGDRASIPPDQGIFLPTTRRLHPAICRFISDAVYDGRLRPEAGTARRELLLSPAAHEGLRSSGIRFLEINHRDCSQKSVEEGQLIKDLYESLLKEHYRDLAGQKLPIGQENILVVAPFNIQVNHLKEVLPAGARVGTVDKFQGQEAEVVLISMTSSSPDDLPRHVDFFYSKNRLNVAVSRARSLAVVVANPALLDLPCSQVEHMRLVNTLCWLRDYAQHPL